MKPNVKFTTSKAKKKSNAMSKAETETIGKSPPLRKSPSKLP